MLRTTCFALLLTLLLALPAACTAEPAEEVAAEPTPTPESYLWITTITPATSSPRPTIPNVPENPEDRVYTARGSAAPPKSGSVVWRAEGETTLYHSVADCDNVKEPYEVTIDRALIERLLSCPKCWKR